MSQSDSITPAAEAMWIQQMNQYGRDKIPFLFVLDFKLISPMVIPLEELSSTGVRYQIHGVPQIAFDSNNEPSIKKHPVSIQKYERGFEKVMEAIQAGDTYLLNLSYATQLEGIQNLEEIFVQAVAPYKLMVRDQFVVFSPESFVRIEDGVIRTYPMKGTIDASLPDAEQRLLADRKEQEEHATVVDLLRNDLSIVAEKVTVERYRYITRIETPGKSLLQCSSEITGKLPLDYHNHLGDIMNALLPAGSVTGAPKKRTVELIESIEPEPRGYYTGVFGIFDGERLDSAVMIRMIEQRADKFYYRSGGGITYRSDAESEYQEMLDKVYLPK
ncbi:MAG: aminodeoxychorismate synthase component I [Bacteroidota bacterium]|nr:aminodeoxychorismate synthase component I [Bacteroidota bacterium]